MDAFPMIAACSARQDNGTIYGADTHFWRCPGCDEPMWRYYSQCATCRIKEVQLAAQAFGL
jgi:hypothetical protein